MATITTSRPRGSRLRWSLILGLALGLIALAAIFMLLLQSRSTTTATPPGWQLLAASTGPIDASVAATGVVEARTQAELRFAQDGQVTAVLVEPGQQVRAGEALAQIDTSELELSLAQARSELQQAQAEYLRVQETATAEEIAAAQARVEQARAQYRQAAGRVTAADIDAARAQVEQARARLDQLLAGPATDERAAAEQRLQNARSTLEAERSRLASEKERARLDLAAAADALRTRQDEYSRVYWEVEQLRTDLAAAGLNLPQEQIDRRAAAERAMREAEANLEKARIAYADAQRLEISTLQAREADLRAAQAEYDRVLAGARPEDLAGARAELQRAEAALTQLLGENRQGELQGLQAGIAAAEAELQRLSAEPAASELLRAEAGVARAELAIAQAELALERATLLAPFDATVAQIGMRVGERSSQQAAIILVADLSSLHINVNIDELYIAQIQPGQPVRINFDALPDAEIGGTVSSVAPIAQSSANGTNTYRVQVRIDDTDTPVRPGMTAVLQIVTERKADVLLVPRRAIVSEGGQSYVRIPVEGPSSTPGEPAYQRRLVTLGLSNAEFTEISSGLQPGEQVYVQDVVRSLNVTIN